MYDYCTYSIFRRLLDLYSNMIAANKSFDLVRIVFIITFFEYFVDESRSVFLCNEMRWLSEKVVRDIAKSINKLLL